MLRPKPPGGPMPGPGPWPCIADTYPRRSQAEPLFYHSMSYIKVTRCMGCWRGLRRSAKRKTVY